MTNGDKIKQMTDEELAQFISCFPTWYCANKYKSCDVHDCADCVRDWIKQEVKEREDNGWEFS